MFSGEEGFQTQLPICAFKLLIRCCPLLGKTVFNFDFHNQQLRKHVNLHETVIGPFAYPVM